MLLLLQTGAGYVFQSWRYEVESGRRGALLAELQTLLLPSIGDAGTTCRGVHRSTGDCSTSFFFFFPVPRQPLEIASTSVSRLQVTFALHDTSDQSIADIEPPFYSIVLQNIFLFLFLALFFSLFLYIPPFSLFSLFLLIPLWKGKKYNDSPPTLSLFLVSIITFYIFKSLHSKYVESDLLYILSSLINGRITFSNICIIDIAITQNIFIFKF